MGRSHSPSSLFRIYTHTQINAQTHIFFSRTSQKGSGAVHTQHASRCIVYIYAVYCIAIKHIENRIMRLFDLSRLVFRRFNLLKMRFVFTERGVYCTFFLSFDSLNEL